MVRTDARSAQKTYEHIQYSLVIRIFEFPEFVFEVTKKRRNEKETSWQWHAEK